MEIKKLNPTHNEMKKSILNDHIRVKKKFIAPMNTIPQNGLYYFDEIVPEILWIAIIIHHLGISESVRVLKDFAGICNDIVGDSILFNPAHIPEYCKLNDSQKELIVAHSSQAGILKPIVSSLTSTLLQFKDCPLIFLSKNSIKGELNVSLLKSLLRSLHNSGTTNSVITLATSLYILAIGGRICMPNYGWNFDDVLDYPTTDQSLYAASHIRSNHNAIFALNRGDYSLKWQKSFWETCLLIEPFKITSLESKEP